MVLDSSSLSRSLAFALLLAGAFSASGCSARQIFNRTSAGVRGAAIPSQDVAFTFFCDDFFASPDKHATTDANGNVSVTFSAAETQAIKDGACTGHKYIHINAGQDYSLVEKVRAL